jgi:hypothetical protein
MLLAAGHWLLVSGSASSKKPGARRQELSNLFYFEYRISNKEFRMMKFISFDIQHSIFDILRFSVF